MKEGILVKTRLLALAVVLLCVVPSAASEPGQPLDCSDWVLTKPGLSCTVYAAHGSVPSDSVFLGAGSNAVVTNEGTLLAFLRFAQQRSRVAVAPAGDGRRLDTDSS